MTRTRTFLTGLGALTLMLAITFGLPAVLLSLDIALSPHDIASGGLFRPDDGTMALKFIALIAWIAWALFTTSVVLELVAKVSGVRAPQLPGMSLPQGWIRALIGAVVMAAVALSGTAANAAPVVRPHTSATATQSPTSETETPTTQAPPSAPTREGKTAATTTYTVAQNDTLWSIAETVLGDGSRFPEIIALNPDLLHGKGNFLRVGWQLKLPAPSDSSSASYTVRAGDTLSRISHDRLGRADRYPEIAKASAHIRQPDGRHLTDPDLVVIGWTLRIPHAPAKTAPSQPLPPPRIAPPKPAAKPTTAPRPITPTAPATQQAPQAPQAEATKSSEHTAPATSTPTPTHSSAAAAPTARPSTQTPRPSVPTATAPATQEPAQSSAPAQGADTAMSMTSEAEESSWITPTLWGVGGILAAGLVALLARRRREQQRRRLPGQAMPMPSGEVAQIETDLREAAANAPLERVDLALRALAQHCADTQTVLPAAHIARLAGTHLELWLDLPQQLPHPWQAITEDTAWALDLNDDTLPDPASVEQVTAPYPCLVTLGIDEEGAHILVDLEYFATLNVTTDGASEVSREILAALAVELATSTWADDLQVTLVGGFPHLEDCLRTGRIRYAPTAEAVLTHLEHRAAADRATLSDYDVVDVRDARTIGAAPDTWTPEILVIAGDITPRHRRLITSLVTDMPRVAIAAVTTGEELGAWSLDVVDNGATLRPAGLPMTPQRIPLDKLPDLLEMTALSTVDELDAHPAPLATEPTLADVEAALRGHAPSERGSADPTTIPFADLAPGRIEDEDDAESETRESVTPAIVEEHEGRLDRALDEAPRINVLGPIRLDGATGPIEAGKEGSCLELLTYIHLHPGQTGQEIEDAIWPNRPRGTSTRTLNSTMSRLRKWLGTDADGQEYLPKYTASRRYRLHDDVTSDIAAWDALINGNPIKSSSDNLDAALALIRGVPFPAKKLRYFWAESIGQRITAEIVDAAWESGRRHLMAGRPLRAEAALAIGINVAPAVERLWRLRILAAHETGDQAAQVEAIARLELLVTERDEELEQETIALLDDLKAGTAALDRLIANE